MTTAVRLPIASPNRPPGAPPAGARRRRQQTIQSLNPRFPQRPPRAPDESVPLAAPFLSNRSGRQLYKFFQTWDADGSGTLCKNEFFHIMKSIGGSKVSEEDMQTAWDNVDKDRSGVVEYYELLEWVLEPGCQLTFTEQQGRQYAVAAFNLREVLEPLYSAFDLNGDGVISKDEFRQAHAVLHGAIDSFATSGYGVHEPPVCLQNPDLIFDKVDLDNSQSITKEEFVAWQREAIRKSGLSNEDLAVLLPSLAKHLRAVFHLIEKDEDGEALDALESAALQSVVQAIADHARELWNRRVRSGQVVQRVEDDSFRNKWRTPPVGINVNRLLATHLGAMPKPFHPDDEHERMRVVCIPALESAEWLAEVSSRAADETMYYVYRKADFVWEPMEDEARFQESWENMAPEVQLFCLMKTEGNFAPDVNWASLDHALRGAIERGVVTQDNVAAFRRALESQTERHLYAEAIINPQTTPRTKTQQVADSMVRKITIPMVTVLARFCEFGVFPLSRVWEEIMDAT